jgi:hypothetical protein
MASGSVTNSAGGRGSPDHALQVGGAETIPILKFTLPVAPPLNNAYANLPGSGRIKTARHRAWLKQADAFYVFQALARAPRITVPFDVHLVFPRIRGDVDGRGKLVIDWLVSRGLTIDDKHARRVTLEIDLERTDGLVHVEVKPHARS